MDRRRFLLTSLAGAFALPLVSEAQQAGKVYRIGLLLTTAPGENAHTVKALEQGLRELGYVEGRNLVLERRFAEGQQERLPTLAGDLVRLNVDIIVTGSNPVIAAVKLELLKEAVPRVSRVAFLWNPVPPGAGTFRNVVDTAARSLNVTIQSVQIRARNELEDAFAAMVRERANGIVVAQDPITLGSRNQVVLLAAKSRIPAVYALREFVEAGGLMSYGPNIADQFRRAAVHVDKILKGAKPGDLPVEQATRFELLINLKTAQALGLTIPPPLLARADQVTE